MAEVLVFTVVGIGLYFVANWILGLIESAVGRTFEERSLIFFVVLLVLTVGSFALIRSLFAE
jgi:hypothetical protein